MTDISALYEAYRKVYLEFDKSKRPSKDHVVGILFPVASTVPQMIWLKCQWWPQDEEEMDEVTERYQLPESEEWLGKVGRDIPVATPMNDKGGRDTLFICARDTFLCDGSQFNECIGKIMTSKPGKVSPWRGPIIGYRKDGREFFSTECKDLAVDDLKRFIDSFLNYPGAGFPCY
jgi:hypothetical protein